MLIIVHALCQYTNKLFSIAFSVLSRRKLQQIAENSAFCYRIFHSKSLARRLLTVVLLTMLPGTPAEAAVTSEIPEYALTVRLLPKQQLLDAQAEVRIPGALGTRPLYLAPQAEIRSVTCDGQPADHRFERGELRIAITSPPRQCASVRIDYRAVFADPTPASTIGMENPSFGVSAIIGDEGTFLSAEVPWFPQFADLPGRHRVRVTSADGQTAVTAGQLVAHDPRAETTISEWRNDVPLRGLALAAGRFEVARDELDGIQLLTFLSAENAALAPVYLAAMRRHLAFYRNLLGPYPFAKFAVAENFLPTGFGLPSWTLLGKSVIRLPFLPDTSLPHEIVHSWWGNAVEVDYARGNWCEGLATYLADYLLDERNNPPQAQEYRRKILRDYATLVPAESDIPLRAFRGRMSRAQQAVGYGKGAMVFHMLRREVGEQPFWDALRRLAAEGNGRRIGWEEIERLFAEVSGRELRWFFRQWIEQPGAPELSLADVRIARGGEGWTVSGVVRQDGSIYRLALPVQIRTADGAVGMHSVTLSGMRTPFRWTAAARPLQLDADPDNHLFRRLAPAEVPATINDLHAAARPLVVVAAGRTSLLEAARDLLAGLHWESAEIVGEDEVDPRLLGGRDLLLIGWPRRAELRPFIPAGLSLGSGGPFDWRETRGDLLFGVFRRNPEQAAVSAVLLAGDAATLRSVAAKIPHYGRYSLLLFAAGRNVVKTTWDPEQSPLRILFSKESRS